MTFKQRLLRLAAEAPNHTSRLRTEEATKHTLILPFFEILGFKMTGFDSDAIPEYTADVAGKKGEKVDYAIKNDTGIILLVECKPVKTKFIQKHTAQLQRYFHAVDESVVAILTNGIDYRFYADLINLNKLDPTPFFKFSLPDINDWIINELEFFTKDNFDAHEVIERARQLAYTQQIQSAMIAELSNPSRTFVKFFVSKIYKGRKTTTVIEQFTPIVKQAILQLLNNPTEQLSSVLTPVEQTPEDTKKNKLSPTDDEFAGFQIVKSLMSKTINTDRLTMRKNLSYCPILLDDNNRRAICRLHFSTSQKYIGLFDHERNETRVPIDTIEDILAYSSQMKATIHFLDTNEISDALQITPIKSEADSKFSRADRKQSSRPYSLSRGENISLTKISPQTKHLLVGLKWGDLVDDLEVDSSIFLLDASGHVPSDDYFIFFNNLTSPDNAVQHMSNQQTIFGVDDDEAIQISLEKVEAAIQKIVFTITIYNAEERNHNFTMLNEAKIRVFDRSNNRELIYYDLSEQFSLETAMIFGELYRHNNEWKFRAVGQGFEGGLSAMAETFGVDVS